MQFLAVVFRRYHTKCKTLYSIIKHPQGNPFTCEYYTSLGKQAYINTHYAPLSYFASPTALVKLE